MKLKYWTIKILQTDNDGDLSYVSMDRVRQPLTNDEDDFDVTVWADGDLFMQIFVNKLEVKELLKVRKLVMKGEKP